LLWTFLLVPGTVRGSLAFSPSPQESSVPARFRLEAETFWYDLQFAFATPRYTVWRLRFPSPITTPDLENNVVWAEYFEPTGVPGPKPAVVVLHILGSDFPLSRYMAARLADQGVAALFLKLPYYGERRGQSGPGPVPRKFLTADIERTVTAMRQGICDVRRALYWLSKRPGIDPGRLGVTGISLGGIISSIVAAADPAVRSGAFLLAGGNLSRILWGMPETARFRESWQGSGRDIADLKILTEPFDPLAYAERLKGKRLLMIAGKVDEVIPPESALELWKAAGRPPIHWYDCGHYSAAGYLLPGIRKIVEFFADRP
jgi:dienelactone hydrolase